MTENALRVIAYLNPEQLAERADALALECSYWQHVLDDAAKVNEAVLAGSLAMIEAVTAALTLMVLLPPEQLPLVETIVSQNRDAMQALKDITDALGETLELADGRQRALKPIVVTLRHAAGVDTDDTQPTEGEHDHER